MDVSIVVITYNHGSFLRNCLLSCINQQKSNLTYEIIVVNDGSTDDTEKIFNQFRHEKINFFSRKNEGIEKSANFAFGQSRGDYIVRVDADDALMPDYLSVLGDFLDTEAAFFYPNYIEIDEMGNELKLVNLPEFDPNEILSRGDFLATGTLLRADVIKKFRGYREKMVNSGLENYELIIDVILEGLSGKHISSPLFKYRRHNQNLSLLKRQEIIENGYDLFLRKNLGNFRTNKFHPYDLQV